MATHNPTLPRLRRAFCAGAVAALALALSAPGAAARPGDRDPSFGGDGRTVADVVGYANAFPTSMAIDARGRIVVAGLIPRPQNVWAVVARFNPDGSLDPSFGDAGVVRPQWGGSSEGITGVAVDSSGRIVLGGYRRPPYNEGLASGYDFAVARLLDGGAPDPSFAGDGLLTVDGGANGADFGAELTLDERGRILLAGSAESPAAESLFAVVRVTDTGVPDLSFGAGGLATVDFGEGSAAEAIAIDTQGRVVLAGSAELATNPEFAVARLDAGGQPDPSFSEDGRAMLSFGPLPSRNVATDVAVDPLGRLLLVGRSGNRPTALALIGRLLPDGSPDPALGGGGGLILGPLGPAEAGAVALDRAGRILVAGTLGEAEGEEAFLARLGPDGLFDSSFGRAGIVREDFLAQRATGAAVAIDSAGRYLLAGGAWGQEVKGFGVARYLSEETPAAPVGRCRGKVATMVGTEGADRLRGTRGRDVVLALGGADRIRSGHGNDLICAGAGRDVVRAGTGNDRVFGGDGGDRLFGQAGRDRLRGGRGNDAIVDERADRHRRHPRGTRAGG